MSTPPPSYSSTPLQATCHCTAVTLTLPHPPTAPLNECLCTVCYRYGSLWAYYPRESVLVTADAGVSTKPYVRKDMGKSGTEESGQEFHFCDRCGSVTHWWTKEGEERERWIEEGKEMMGVNFRGCGREMVERVGRRVSEGPKED